MLLTCPSCKARYLVADTVIGPSGRRVRCASCKEVWQQQPPIEESHRDIVGRNIPVRPPVESTERDPQFSPQFGVSRFQPLGSVFADTALKPRVDEAASAYNNFDMKIPQSGDTDADADTPVFKRRPVGSSPFEEERPRSQAAVMAQEISRVSSRRRRSSSRTGTYWLAGGFGLLLLGNIYFWSDSVGRFVKSLVPGVANMHMPGTVKAPSVDAVSALKISYTKPVPVLRNGHKVLPISGTISNPTPNTLTVPRLHGVLLDDTGKEIFNWSFPAPTVELGTGQTTTFDTEANDIPENAKSLRIGFETSGPAG